MTIHSLGIEIRDRAMRSVRDRSERGAITVWTAVALIGFILIVGIGVDRGAGQGHAGGPWRRCGSRPGGKPTPEDDGRAPEPRTRCRKKGGRELRGGVPVPRHGPGDRQ